MATMRQVMESDPVAPRKLNPAVPPDLETICLKCLEKNPARRYHSAGALAEELGRFLNHEPVQAIPVSAVRKSENWLRRHPWTLIGVASLAILVLMGMFYWQYERVRFLEHQSLLSDQAPGHPGLQTQQLQSWRLASSLVFLTAFCAIMMFRRSQAKGTRQVSLQATARARHSAVSQRMRVVCGLIGVAALAFTMLYFAELIKVRVWEGTQAPTQWICVYVYFYFSLTLLFLVVRDYQKFVHGLPSRSFSAEQIESLNREILDGDIFSAIKLYRRTVPDASPDEAAGYVRKLGAELQANHPEKFVARKLSRSNWRAMGICLVVEIVAFAGFWLMMPPLVPTGSLLASAIGFFFGAGILASFRLKGFWRRFLVRLNLLLCIPLALETTLGFFHVGMFFFFGGIAFGACMIATGFIGQRPPTKVSPPL
jgi:hypothetical protein